MIMTRKSKALLALTLVFCLVLCLLPATAVADDGVDLDRAGSIRLKVTNDHWEALADVTVDVNLYQVAAVNASGVFTPVGKFAENATIASELAGINFGTDMGKLADVVLSVIYVQPEETEDAEQEPEEIRVVDPVATIEDLNVTSGEIAFGTEAMRELGIYLLEFSETDNGVNSITFAPLLLSVPSLGLAEDAENGILQPEEGAEQPEATPQVHLDWQYSYTIYMKPSYGPLYGKLWIEKDLLSYNKTLSDPDGATFNFEVTVMDEDGNVQYVFFTSLNFTEPGVKYALMDQLPVGSLVRIREVRTSGYTQVGAITPSDTLQVKADNDETRDEFVFHIENTTDDSIIPSVGVVNRFVYDGMGWQWEHVVDNSTDGRP